MINNISFEEACRSLNTSPLVERRLNLCQTLFTQIVRDKTHVLHYLLASKRDIQLTAWPLAIDKDVSHSLRED